MIVLQTIAVAFAMFSAVPVPQFVWDEKNMRYALCAFPLVGLLCGVLWCVCGVLPLPAPARAAGFCLAPVWVTGGIHLDGYADTCDALASCAAPVFEKIAQLRGERPFFTPYAIAVLRSNGRFSNAKATAMLGYHARPLRETLQSMILWFQGQNLISPAL